MPVVGTSILPGQAEKPLILAQTASPTRNFVWKGDTGEENQNRVSSGHGSDRSASLKMVTGSKVLTMVYEDHFQFTGF